MCHCPDYNLGVGFDGSAAEIGSRLGADLELLLLELLLLELLLLELLLLGLHYLEP